MLKPSPVSLEATARQRIALSLGCVAAAFALALVLPASTALAQFQRYGVGALQGRFIEPPRSIAQAISDAEDAIAAERFSDAVVTLGDLLARDAVAAADADLAGQDFFLESEQPTQQAINRSLMRQAEEVLGRLPARGMEIYELRYGAKAQQMLGEATAATDRRMLRGISRRYFHTQAGYQATYLLALLEISEGRPVAAVSVLRRLAAQPLARERFGDALLMRLAQAEALAGQSTSAAEHLLASTQGGLETSIGGQAVTPPAAGSEADWLAEHFGTLGEGSPGSDASLAGGGVAGQGAGGGGFPLSGIRWDLPTTAGQHQRTALEEFLEVINSGDVPPPTWQPIVVGNQLLMRTTERMMAVDFTTGKRVWEYPWANPTEAVEEEGLAVNPMGDAEAARELLYQRVWNDVPYGRISSDGERVYVLEDLGELAISPYAGAGVIGIRSSGATNAGSNTLVALELATEGKLLWTRGRDGNEPEIDGLADAFFLGPPLPVEGLLYQLAELAGDSYLLCLDPQNGRELWRQQLLSGEGASVLSDPARRIGGAIPAYSDGILVCPTSASAIVAMDLTSRTLLWGNYLPVNDANVTLQGIGGYQATPDQGIIMKRRWLDGTPTIVDGCVLVTPVESERLFGYDLLTGEPLWPPLLRDDYRYLAGARDGRFLLVSQNRVMAFDLRTGQPAWTQPMTLPPGETVVGTGVFGQGTYLLPTSQNALVEIDLSSGQVMRRRDLQFPVGNLMAVDGSIVAQSATTLSVAYAEAPLRELVEQRLESDPEDHWAIVRNAELLLEEGQRQEAIEWLMRARQQDAQDEEVRMLLVGAMLDAIRSGDAPPPEATELLDQLIEMPAQRAEFLKLKALRGIDQDQPAEALAALVELSDIVLRQHQLARPQQMRSIESADGSRASVDAWIASRVHHVYSSVEPTERESLDQQVAAHVEPLIAESATIQRRVVAQFGRSPATERIRGALFAAALDEGAWIEAERIAQDALHAAARDNESADEARTTTWRLNLVRLYKEAEFAEDAAAILAELDASGEEISELQRELAEMTAPAEWPAGVTVSTRDDLVRSRTQLPSLTPADVVARTGHSRWLWQPMVDRTGAVWIRDAHGKDHQIPFETTRSQPDALVQASMDSGLMVLLMQKEIVAFDMLSMATRPIDAELWRRPWAIQSSDGSSRSRSVEEFFQDNRRSYVITGNGLEGQAGVMRLGPIVGGRMFMLEGRDVIALDVVNGDEVWRSSGYAPDAYIVADGEHVGVVDEEAGVTILSAFDGARIREEPWEPSERIYMAAGPHLLTLQNQPTQSDQQTPARTVRLRSPIDNRVVLEATLEGPAGAPSIDAFARLVNGRHMFLLSGEGRLIIWDLLAGRAIGDTQVDVGGTLSGLTVIPWRDAFILALIRRPDRHSDDPQAAQLYFQSGPDHGETDGPIIAISASDGSVLWRHELSGPWGISRTQPGASPLVLLTRSLPRYRTQGKAERTMDLLAIDTRNGEIAAHVDAMKVESNFTQIATATHVVPDQEMVEVSTGRYIFTFQFSDNVIPEEERVLAAEIIQQQIDEADAARQEGLRGIDDPQAPPAIPLR